MARHFLSQNDLSPDEVRRVFDAAAEMKREPREARLPGRSLVMFLEKPSTRTRLSFEIGMTQLGGHAVNLDPQSSQLSRGESIADTAQVVARYADLMMARVFSQETVAELAKWSSIPVINGLSDVEHPCQSMTDLFTVREHKGRVAGLKIAYVGDGDNNVTNSLILGATQLGAQIVVASPIGLQPSEEYVRLAEENAQQSGGSVTVTDDPDEAATSADVVYTDVWTSMGREAGREERIAALRPYQVNDRLMSLSASDSIFMHCLPAHIGEEVTADVAYGPHSVIFDEAENRLHVQKALMVYLLGQGAPPAE